MVWTICMIMHYYPSYTKEDIMNLTQSQISYLMQMVWLTKNPQWLDKYKTVKFSSEFEFEQYILNKFKLI